jgi:hypothetical protein
VSGEKIVFPGGTPAPAEKELQPGDPGYTLVCPLLSQAIPTPPQLAGGNPGLAMIEGGCIGNKCGFFSNKRGACGVGD